MIAFSERDSNNEIIKIMRCILAQVDDANEIKKIYQRALDAIASLIKLLESSDILDQLVNSLLEANLPVQLESLIKLPVITSVKVSLINLLRNNELPSLADLYYAYRYILNFF